MLVEELHSFWLDHLVLLNIKHLKLVIFAWTACLELLFDIAFSCMPTCSPNVLYWLLLFTSFIFSNLFETIFRRLSSAVGWLGRHFLFLCFDVGQIDDGNRDFSVAVAGDEEWGFIQGIWSAFSNIEISSWRDSDDFQIIIFFKIREIFLWYL